MATKYITKVESDENGELVILFPEELLKEMSWKAGDLLCWTALPDGSSFLINKIERIVE